MAKKDRKKWLKLFYNRWGYEPTSVMRKKHEYIKKIPLDEALMIATETDRHFLIQVIFPFESSFPVNKESTNSVTIFPRVVYYNKNSLYEIIPLFYALWLGWSFFAITGAYFVLHLRGRGQSPIRWRLLPQYLGALSLGNTHERGQL